MERENINTNAAGISAAVIGSTGLTGSQLLRMLLEDPAFAKIKVLARRPVVIERQGKDSKAEVIVVDFGDEADFGKALDGCDVIFCTVGTTIKNVKGDKVAYRHVDYDIPVNASRLGAAAGCKQIIMISSVGADASSKTFYLRLKGEAEKGVAESGIESVTILRPSMLLGKRGEFRFGELVAKVIMEPLSFLIPKSYKPVHVSQVASVMIAAAKMPQRGVRVINNSEICSI
jgi:uncharacterized protein YbjT (DUF2867 family)